MVHSASAEPNQEKECTNDRGKWLRVCYWPNGDGEVADTMGDQRHSSYSTRESSKELRAGREVTFWPSNYKRKGYGFAGWSDKFDWVLNENDEDGNGTGPNAAIVFSDRTNGLIWEIIVSLFMRFG